MQDRAEETRTTGESGAVQRGTGRRGMWRVALRGVALATLLPAVFVLVAGLMLIGRDVTAPSWVVRAVEERAADLLGGGSLVFREIGVSISDTLRPRVILRDAILRDGDGLVIARVPQIEAGLSPRGAVQGRALVQQVHLTGAQIELRRGADGSVALAFESSGSEVGTARDFIGLLDEIDRSFETGALEALRQVTAEGLIINYSDARAGRFWTVDDGRLSLVLGAAELELRASIALLSARDYVTSADMVYRSPRGSPGGEVSFEIANAAAEDIASQSAALSWLSVLDAPISAEMTAALSEEGTLAALDVGLRPNHVRQSQNAARSAF